MEYCKFGNFRENFIFANSGKRHICHGKMSRLRHELIDRVISPGREGIIFTKLRICEVSRNKTLAKISEFTVKNSVGGAYLLICMILKLKGSKIIRIWIQLLANP